MTATTLTSRSKRSSGGFLINSVILFWIVIALLFLVAGLGVWPNGIATDQPLQQFTLVGSGIAAIALSGLLVSRQSWARPAAVIYHLWLGGLLLLLLTRPATAFADLVAALPGWLTADSWTLLLRLVFAVAGVGSLAMAYFLEQPSAWDAFTKRHVHKRGKLCPTCGATEQTQRDGQSFCSYCGTTVRHIYFLQPVLKNARRILIMFEPGHTRIKIGRSVGNGEAWIDTSANKRFRTISRHHADLELDFKTGELTLHKAFTSQEVMVDNVPVLMSASVQLGSLIQLGKVPFVLGNSEYEPTLAYFVDQQDERRRYLLRFNGLNNEQSIGRARDNDVVLAEMPDVAHHHATILFDPGSDMFFIRNDADRNPVYIDGHLLEPGRTTELSNDELIIVQLGAHNFNFLPVLYQPKVREETHA